MVRRKKRREKEEKRGCWFSRRRRRWPWILLILAVAIIFISIAAYLSQKPGEVAPPKRAVILDGLSMDYPNQTFIRSAEKILKQAGFTVDVYGLENITLSLLRKLPSEDYGLVIFRIHGGRMRPPIGIFIDGVLFIERCSPGSHMEEIESGYLLLGRTFLSNETYCVVPPHYITDKLHGRFKGAIIIAMSCFTGDYELMAKAFFKRGAGAYIGFRGKISPAYADAFTINLLRKIYAENIPLQEAFNHARSELGPDPDYKGTPVLYLP